MLARPRHGAMIVLATLVVVSCLAFWLGGASGSDGGAKSIEPRLQSAPTRSQAPSVDSERTVGTDESTRTSHPEVSQSADEPGDDMFRVRVRGSEGELLSGALVQVAPSRESGETAPTIVTDSVGECRVPRADLGRIVVSAPFHATASLAPPSDSVSLLEVALGPGQVLAGVTQDARTAQPVRARIVDWPTGQVPPPPNLVVGGMRGDRNVAYVESDEDGAFRIEGLHPGMLYSVMAAAPATGERSVLALPKPIAHRSPGAEALDLGLVPLFGLEVRTREESGVGLATGAKL